MAQKKGSRKKLKCAWCKKSVLRFPSQIKPYKFGCFCNHDCLGLFRSKHLTGSLAANYKDGLKRDRQYIRVPAPWHPNHDKKGTVSLHKIILEARLGRFLQPFEVVHHKDNNPENNHWENLESMRQNEHAALHNEMKVRLENGRFCNKKRNKTPLVKPKR